MPAVGAGAVSSTLPAPTLIESAVTSSYAAPCDPQVCAVPDVLVKQGDDFQLTVTLSAAGQPAAFAKDTTLSLTAPGHGLLVPTTVTMAAGASTQVFAVSYSIYANAVTVTAAVAGNGKQSKIVSTSSNAFDVLQTLKSDPASPGVAFQDGTGLENCAATDATNPVCGVVVLPNGSGSDVLLSTGSCAGLGCKSAAVVSQVITDTGGLYTRTAPATVILECNRTLCGKGGVNKYVALASQQAGGPLSAAPACPAKGVIGADQMYCTDYVQSTRDGADNLLLYVLFFDDFRLSI